MCGKASTLYLQHRPDGIAGFAFSGLVHRNYPAFPFPAAFLVRERDFAFDGRADVGPCAAGAFAG